MSTTKEQDEHMRKFKNKGKDIAEIRRRKIEVRVELRKARKDEQILKRRNICFSAESSLSPEKDEKNMVTQISLIDVVELIQSDDLFLQLKATQAVRKMLSKQKNPPVSKVIESGIIPKLVEFLHYHDTPNLQFESAWALTNVASGTSEQTKAVIDANGIQGLVDLLSSPHIHICEQSVWALGNIAGDGPMCRDTLISFGVIPPILSLVMPSTPVGFLRTITWTLSNLCRNKKPHPPLDAVKQVLPTLTCLLQHPDKDIISDTCWAMCYLTDGSNHRIQVVVEAGVLSRLVELLFTTELSILTPALRALGNVIAGTDEQTQMVIDAGILSVLPQLLLHPKASVQKEAAWALSNIAAGPCSQIQQLITCGLLPPLVELLDKGDYKAQKEGVWAVANFTMGGTVQQVVSMIRAGVMKPLLNLLSAKDSNTILVILESLSNFFRIAEKLGETEKLGLLVEELEGVEKIEALQTHENNIVYRAALTLIEKYFSGEEVEDKNPENEEKKSLPFADEQQDCFNF
ncbi:importin subunit alpha-8 isoform X2 [Pseudonaja textilis]|uniref:importin subunit alpha-8 isoform X2 n=1 Tax=Pseudonaja textilis TaxID=8673 RepID=UPI000EAA7936|nr:importin subunit alpha-8 isoform X2 [Pseudonaja textilis]